METFDTVMMMNKNFQGTDTVPYQHLHAQLLSLKDRHTNKEFDLAKTKAEIRSHLVDYRSRIPDLNGWRRHGEIGSVKDAEAKSRLPVLRDVDGLHDCSTKLNGQQIALLMITIKKSKGRRRVQIINIKLNINRSYSLLIISKCL